MKEETELMSGDTVEKCDLSTLGIKVAGNHIQCSALHTHKITINNNETIQYFFLRQLVSVHE